MFKVIILFGVLFCFFTFGPAQGSDIYVPDDYSTIQDAIDFASDGDSIIVRPGTYLENIDFVGKAVTVRSEQGAGTTTIDGNQAGSVVTFQSGEGAGSVLDGFAVTNGLAPGGGGIFCDSSSPTVTGNTISGNTADHGGGICCYDHSSPTITNNDISLNGTELGNGGGIYCYNNSSPAILNNTISDNSSGNGGGIYCRNACSPIITHNTISGNDSGDGGGIYCFSNCFPTITSSTISGNTARWNGGGGIYCRCSSSPIIVNTIISANDGGYCGAIFCYNDASPTILNSTIADNLANWGGGDGIHCGRNCFPTITNTIFWNGATEVHLDGGNPSITYSDVKGGWTGTGNIDADPLFAESTSGDFHLTWNSPCRNMGDNSAVTESYDFEGDPRIHDDTVDMGADEFHLHLYAVGDVLPAATIDLKVVGVPGTTPLTLGLGSGIQDPPQSTPFGYLYLQWPILGQIPMPDMDGNGLSVVSGAVPWSWQAGEEYPLQVKAGDELTNLLVLIVE